jgi:hypothetical protein
LTRPKDIKAGAKRSTRRKLVDDSFDTLLSQHSPSTRQDWANETRSKEDRHCSSESDCFSPLFVPGAITIRMKAVRRNNEENQRFSIPCPAAIADSPSTANRLHLSIPIRLFPPISIHTHHHTLQDNCELCRRPSVLQRNRPSALRTSDVDKGTSRRVDKDVLRVLTYLDSLDYDDVSSSRRLCV